MNQQTVIRRGDVGHFGSFIGGLGLLAGVLGFIWQGGFTPVIGAFLAIGLIGIGLWAALLPDEFRQFITGRQVRYGTMAFFSTLLLIGVVALTYIIIQRQVLVADVTIDSRFTLSETTLNILDVVARSPRPIEITAFYYPEEVIQREIDDQYYQLYESLSGGKIRRNYVNPLEEPAFSARYMEAIAQGIHTFVSFVNEDGTLDIPTTVAVNNRDMQERDMTQAIASLLTGGAFKFYYVTSLGTADAVDNTQQGVSMINNVARTNGFITDPLDLTQLAQSGQKIPADASAVAIIRPLYNLLPAEIAVLDEYLKRGGALFIAADVFFIEDVFMADGNDFNEYLWQNYGLRMTQAVVVDLDSSQRTALEVISAAVFGDNEIAANINLEGDANSAVMFNLARAIELDDTPPVSNGRVIMSSTNSWGETDWAQLAASNSYEYNADSDIAGPLTLVAWAHNQQTNAKIVLVGDGDFLLNGQVFSPQGNATLFLNSMGWLTGFSSAVEFGPQSYLTAPLLFVGGADLDVIAFITVILMPLTMLVAATAIWIRRLQS